MVGFMKNVNRDFESESVTKAVARPPDHQHQAAATLPCRLRGSAAVATVENQLPITRHKAART
jgi:hypothetical protein